MIQKPSNQDKNNQTEILNPVIPFFFCKENTFPHWTAIYENKLQCAFKKKNQHVHIFKCAVDTVVRNISICICYQEIKRNSFQHSIFTFPGWG